jgi:hypothetical protein
MDLFVDKYFKKDVENKFNYYQLLYGTTDALPAGVVLIGNTGNTVTISHNNTILVCDPSPSALNLIKARKNNVYLQEYTITSNCKKYIVE